MSNFWGAGFDTDMYFQFILNLNKLFYTFKYFYLLL